MGVGRYPLYALRTVAAVLLLLQSVLWLFVCRPYDFLSTWAAVAAWIANYGILDEFMLYWWYDLEIALTDGSAVRTMQNVPQAVTPNQGGCDGPSGAGNRVGEAGAGC